MQLRYTAYITKLSYTIVLKVATMKVCSNFRESQRMEYPDKLRDMFYFLVVSGYSKISI